MTYKNGLAHERESLGVPEIAIVDSTHEDVGEDNAYILVDLQPNGVVQTAGADEVPVEAP